MIACVRTVDVSADVRERHLAWVAEGAPPLPPHLHSHHNSTLPPHPHLPGRYYRPITRYDVTGGYLNLPGLHDAEPTPEEDR